MEEEEEEVEGAVEGGAVGEEHGLEWMVMSVRELIDGCGTVEKACLGRRMEGGEPEVDVRVVEVVGEEEGEEEEEEEEEEEVEEEEVEEEEGRRGRGK